jgi:hypothetical protein
MTSLAFYGVRASTVAMQWFGKNVSTVEVVFSAWSLRRLYNDIYRHNNFQSRVEAGSNTSTVTLRVVGGDDVVTSPKGLGPEKDCAG